MASAKAFIQAIQPDPIEQGESSEFPIVLTHPEPIMRFRTLEGEPGIIWAIKWEIEAEPKDGARRRIKPRKYLVCNIRFFMGVAGVGGVSNLVDLLRRAREHIQKVFTSFNTGELRQVVLYALLGNRQTTSPVDGQAHYLAEDNEDW